jgi:DNA-binding NarL/FixJ family response regulator
MAGLSEPADRYENHVRMDLTGPELLESDMIRVAVIDDHPIARRGVQQILTESGRISVVGSCDSPSGLADALPADGDRAPDVIVLDLFHDGTPCLDAVAELSGTSRVLVMSASGRPADVVGAIRAGAAGYVTKQASPEVLVAAVETVAAGGFALSPRLADILHAELATGGSPGSGAEPALSAREEQVLGLIANGFTHAQVATRMSIHKSTVDTYVERIRAKLQVGNKAELTRAALRRSQAERTEPL